VLQNEGEAPTTMSSSADKRRCKLVHIVMDPLCTPEERVLLHTIGVQSRSETDMNKATKGLRQSDSQGPPGQSDQGAAAGSLQRTRHQITTCAPTSQPNRAQTNLCRDTTSEYLKWAKRKSWFHTIAIKRWKKMEYRQGHRKHTSPPANNRQTFSEALWLYTCYVCNTLTRGWCHQQQNVKKPMCLFILNKP